MVNPEQANGGILKWGRFPRHAQFLKSAFLAGLAVGCGTLFRPESPLLLVACLPVLLWVMFRRGQIGRGLEAAGLAAAGCLLVLLPCTVRNAVSLHEFQPRAPRYAALPGEMVPRGFMNWENTWLYRFREVFLVSWKLNDDVIRMEDLPDRAFDSPEERQHVAAILDQYNEDSNLTAAQDAEFDQIARARTARHPLRTYLSIPFERVITLWFTPRIEQLPVSGSVFPLAETWDTDRLDLCVTVGLFLINLFYVALALWGTLRLWRFAPEARVSVVLLGLFVV